MRESEVDADAGARAQCDGAAVVRDRAGEIAAPMRDDAGQVACVAVVRRALQQRIERACGFGESTGTGLVVCAPQQGRDVGAGR